MRILFFYSEDIRNRQKPDFVHQEVLHGLGMNFDAEWRFEVQAQERGDYVCYVEHCKPLPKYIFSCTGDNVNVSAIVGGNGSGKTSFARMMHRLSLDPKGIRMLLIAEAGGEFYIWGNSIKVEFVNKTDDQRGDECVRVLKQKAASGLTHKDIQSVFKFLYYSPAYTSQHVLDIAKRGDFNGDENFFYDVSTTGLLKHAKGGWQEFEKRDYWDFWRFISAAQIILKPNQIEPESILFVRGVKVEIDWENVDKAENYFRSLIPEGKVIKRSVSGKKQTFLSRLSEVINAFQKCRLMAAHVVYACALCSWYSRKIGDGRIRLSQRDILLLDFLYRVKTMVNQNTDQVAEDVEKEFDLYWETLEKRHWAKDEVGYWCGLYDAFCPEGGPRYSSRTGMYYSFKRYGEESVLNTIIDCHDKLSAGIDFLRIETRPRISSGEWAIISIMSRIYSLKDQIPDGGNMVLFLDEAETSLHPNWQRILVQSIIRFCEMGLTYANFHVIFATHSPIILSDIPSSNVVFLRKKTGRRTSRQFEEDETVVVSSRQKTFGANIYDLFKSSFFLEDGPVGAQAKKRIGDVLKEIAARISAQSDSFRDDPLRFRVNLKDWVDILGDQLLVKYITKLAEAGIIHLEDE